MHRLPYFFLLLAGGLSLATFLTSQTLAMPTPDDRPCVHILTDDFL